MTLREQAEATLARRCEATGWRPTNREAYLDAMVRRLEREQANQPTSRTATAQSAMRDRHDATRSPLPPAATADQIEASKAWLAQMRASLASRRATRE